jgi:VWFA-related protein
MERASRVPILLLAAAAAAQDVPPTFRSEAQVVVLDVVATDRKGQPLDDLRREELQVFEDGQACEILSFRQVRTDSRNAPAGAASGGAIPAEGRKSGPAGVTPVRASLVVLVFDRLGTETAPLARRGALDLLARDFPADTWFAVFKIGYGASVLAPFTTDRARLQSAVERATLGAVDRPSAPAAAVPAAPSASSQEAAPATGPQDVVLPGLREVAERLNAEEAGLLRRVRGLDSLYAVLGIARALGTLEGRKAVVYFAEGWQLPVSTRPAYDDAVSAANRANVAVHVVDARGLTAHKPMGLTPMDSVLDAFTADNREGPGEGAYTPAIKAGGTGDAGGATHGFTPKRLPGDEEERLSGPRLERLAEDTGGLAITNTNDLGAGLARVAAELRQYYEVVYSPANSVQDGRFRRIAVKVSRSGVHLRTRAGYFATPTRSPTLAAYELPLMDALGADTPARDFPLRADVLHFAPKARERECVVLAEVPLSEVQFWSDEASGLYRAHLTLLGYLKDEGGRVVARLTHDWPIEGPLREKEQARRQSAVFRRTLALAPGHYVLEAAVQDRQSNGTSVTRTPFEVPAVNAELSLGSVTLVKRVSPATPGASGSDPLRVGDISLVPCIGEPFEPESGPELPVYVGIYPARSVDPVKLTVELRRDGRTIAGSSPPLPPVDADGRISWVGSIPTERLSSGSYEIVATSKQGQAVAEERTTLEVAAGRVSHASAPAAQARPIDPALVPVLELAGRYVVGYEDKFRNLVAQEVYSQRATVPGSHVDRVDVGGRHLTGDVRQERTTRANLVFVRLAGDIPWGLFRDVFELNGKKVRDRDSRLERLFLHPSPSALDQARKILQESARYNIGGAARTLNLPTLPLVFLHPRNQSRFSYQTGGRRRIAGYEALEVRFEEVARPTLVTDASGGDLPAKGRFWIDPSRGAVVKSEVVFRFEPRLAEGSIETEYRPQPRLGIWVPYEMKEDYRDLPYTPRPIFHAPTHATARYSNFRQFSVSTEEKAALPPPAPE